MVIAMELVFLIEIPAVCEDGRFFCQINRGYFEAKLMNN